MIILPGWNLDTNVLLYLIIVVVLATIAMSLKRSGRIVIKSIFKIIIAGVGIFIFNYVTGNLLNLGDIKIPFNPLTVLMAGLLELPGVALIFIMKYVIYP